MVATFYCRRTHLIVILVQDWNGKVSILRLPSSFHPMQISLWSLAAASVFCHIAASYRSACLWTGGGSIITNAEYNGSLFPRSHFSDCDFLPCSKMDRVRIADADSADNISLSLWHGLLSSSWVDLVKGNSPSETVQSLFCPWRGLWFVRLPYWVQTGDG